MLSGTDDKGAAVIAERIRSSIEALSLDYKGQKIKFTISIGVSSFIPTPNRHGIELMDNADKALYQAKHSGRNCVITYEEQIRNQALLG